jgi:Protein of unknown function (DUF3892)
VIQCTHIRLVGGTRHDHIVRIRWTNPETHATGESTREEMVSWIRRGGVAFVTDGIRTVRVHVVNAVPPYVQTYRDGVQTDNLLALPRF